MTSPLRRQNLKGVSTGRYAKVKARKAVEPDKKNWESPREKQESKEGRCWVARLCVTLLLLCIVVKPEDLGTIITQ